MKLTGSVQQTRETVAKIVDGKVEIKRGYSINIRPASGTVQGYGYGYGSMHFVTHGSELQDFGVGLGDQVEVYLVRKGETVPNRDFEDVSAAFYKAESDLASLREKFANSEKKASEYNATIREGNAKMAAVMAENIRLTTELETLRASRLGLGAMDLKAIGPASGSVG